MLRRILLVLVLALTAAACGESPEVAGAQLAKDGEAVMAWDRWTNKRVTETAQRDVACGDGEIKRVFAATAELPTSNPDADNTLDVASRSIGARLSEVHYEPVSALDQADRTDRRQLTYTKDGLSFTAILTLPSENAIKVELQGATTCQ